MRMEHLLHFGERYRVPFHLHDIDTARFYMQQIMPQIHALLPTIKAGAGSLSKIANDSFKHESTGIAKKPFQRKGVAPGF